MEKGGHKAADKFLDALIKSVQSLCHGYLEFQNGIEIVGFINLSVDKGNSVDCVLKEKVCKTAENATSFISNSYHAKPLPEEAPSGNSQPGNQTAPDANSPSRNRRSSETRDSQFPHPSRGSLKRKAPDNTSGEGSSKKAAPHSNSHRSSSENLHQSSSVSADSSEADVGESADGSSRSPEDMDHVKLTGSGIVLEPVDGQNCAGGEESSDFDVTFIKEEYVEDETSACDYESSADQQLAGDQFRRGQNSSAPFCPISTSSPMQPAASFKVEPGEHQDSPGPTAFQPHPGSSTMRGEERSVKSPPDTSDYQSRGQTLEDHSESSEMTQPSQLPGLGNFRVETTDPFTQTVMMSVQSCSSGGQGTGAIGRILLCEFCDASFTSTAGLYLHKSSVHFKRKFVCSVCDKKFTRKETLTNHMFSHSTPSPRCPKCPYCPAYMRPNLLKQHVATKHPDQAQPE
ncbi:uncharacterized protein LOC143293558 isoform X1 [Babylonia areolata]|uniref:uncharacterized protein LOC143293558 isoform X1 n=1 Tax=Babylonia areolata TaxID=304850 RepID=UPI003FD40263